MIISTKRSKVLKEKYIPDGKYEAFYTGKPIQLSQSGDRLYCHKDSQVSVIDVASGKILFNLEKDDDQVQNFILPPNEKCVLVACKSCYIHQFSTVDGSFLKSWRTHHTGFVKCMDVDGSSSFLATGGTDSSIKVYDFIHHIYSHTFRFGQGIVSVVRFHPGEEVYQLFGAGADYKIHMWDLRTKKCAAILEGHVSTVTALEFTADGSKLFSSSHDKIVIMWDLKNFAALRKMPIFEAVESIFLLPEKGAFPELGCPNQGLHIVTAGTKGVLKVWDALTGKLLHTQNDSPFSVSSESEENENIIKITCNLATNSIMVVSAEQTILFYNLDDLASKKQMVGNWGEILSLRLLGPNEDYLAMATNSPHIKVYDLKTFNCHLLVGHDDLILTVDTFARDPCTLVSGGKDNRVCVWKLDPSNGQVSKLFNAMGHTATVTSIACFKTSSEYFASGGEDNTLKLWKLKSVSKTGKVRSLEAFNSVVAHDKEINALAVSPNDTFIATASRDKLAKIWSFPTLELKGTLSGHKRGLWDVKFSPKDNVVATASKDCTIKIWSLDTFACLKDIQSHTASVLNMVFLPNGVQLASSDADGVVRVFNLNHYLYEEAMVLDEHEEKIWTLTISSDGSRMITGDASSTLVVWKDVTKEEKEKDFEEQKKQIQLMQELSNYMKEENWLKALKLAIQLDKPSSAYPVLKEMLYKKDGEECVTKVVGELSDDEINSLVKYCKFWISNTKHYLPAQVTLKVLLKSFHFRDLLERFPEFRKNLETLKAYAERHFINLNKACESNHYASYLWKVAKQNLTVDE